MYNVAWELYTRGKEGVEMAQKFLLDIQRAYIQIYICLYEMCIRIYYARVYIRTFARMFVYVFI